MVSKDFVTAGKAIFTVANNKGDYYTFRVSKARDNGESVSKPPTFFVAVMTGTDNENHYTYMGLLATFTGAVRPTRNSKITPTDVRFRVAEWALNMIWKNATLPVGYEIKHSGKCGCCARTLTTPESIDLGIGPECLKRLGMRRAA